MAGCVVVVDGGKGAKKEAVDESEDGGAASGDAVSGEEAVDIGEGKVDALGGLKILGSGQQIVREIFDFHLFLLGEVIGTEQGLRIGRELTALTP